MPRRTLAEVFLHGMLCRLAAIAVAALGLAATGPARAVDCIVACRSPAGCTATDAGTHGPLDFAEGQLRRLPNCATARLIGHKPATREWFAEGIFRNPRGPVHFVVTVPDKPLGDTFAALRGADCGIGGNCQDDRERRRRVSQGGMGADEIKLVHQGSPCSIGLPCGSILKPDRALVVRIAGAGESRLVLSGVRGAERADVTYPVRSGRLEIPAAALVSGAVYRYALLGGIDSAPVAGEFSVVSAQMQKDVDDEIADESRKSPDAAALAAIRVLIKEDLLWDANRRIE